MYTHARTQIRAHAHARALKFKDTHARTHVRRRARARPRAHTHTQHACARAHTHAHAYSCAHRPRRWRTTRAGACAGLVRYRARKVTLNVSQIVVSGLDHADAHPDLLCAAMHAHARAHDLTRAPPAHSRALAPARPPAHTRTLARSLARSLARTHTRTRMRTHARSRPPARPPARTHARTLARARRYVSGDHSIGSRLTLRDAHATLFLRLKVESTGPAFKDEARALTPGFAPRRAAVGFAPTDVLTCAAREARAPCTGPWRRRAGARGALQGRRAARHAGGAC
jgi:hypothetical protein